MKQYDIFISYRRSSYDTANLIATRLKAAGYSVFFDMETLRSGKFNEQLFDVIDKCKDFVIVLPPQALDRCVNDDDWVRLEICRAMSGNKNIIPVMLNGFTWPDPMPTGMEELCNFQALTANSVEYFDLAMERLQKLYLHSKRHIPIKKLVKVTSVLLTSVLAFIAIVYGILMMLSMNVCTKYATMITTDANSVHTLAEENNNLAKDWTKFDNTLNYETRQARIEEQKEAMQSRIDLIRQDLNTMWMTDSAQLEIPSFDRFLLSLHGINAEEISYSPVLATMYYSDFTDRLNTIETIIANPSALDRVHATALIEASGYSFNGYYASFLSAISLFPQKSRTVFNESSRMWRYFPSYAVDCPQKYYEDLIYKESEKAMEALAPLKAAIDQTESFIGEMETKLDQLEQQADDVDALNNMIELTQEEVQIYQELKQQCTITESDDQWSQWGKIQRWGKYLSLQVEYSKTTDLPSLITPSTVNNDMKILLADYLSYHSESKEYVISAKQFFNEISQGKRAYAGVIIFGFKDDAKHPFFQAGDIVIAYDGQQIASYNDFKQAFKQNENGKVTYIRLSNTNFEKHENQISDTDIVGFLDLTE